jgi:ketosteroid isomerase-like protein
MNPQAMSAFIQALRPASQAEDPLVAGKTAEDRRVSQVVAMYEAMARGDGNAVRDLLTDDAELEIDGPPEAPTTGHWKGRDQVLAGAARNYGQLEDQRPELLSVVAQGDLVAVIARERGRVRATGREYEMAWVHLYTFRGNQVRRIYGFCDNHALVQAARLDAS